MPITEGELVFPSLGLLAQSNAGMSTTDLMAALREIIDLDDEDTAPLEGRNDDRFSQKVRNLKSHDTFEKLGYATFDEGKFHITDLGRSAYEESASDIVHLNRQGFDKRALSSSLTNHPEYIVIEEGERLCSGTGVLRGDRGGAAGPQKSICVG